MAVTYVKRVGSAAEKVSSTTLAIPLSGGDVAAGNCLIVFLSFDNLTGTTPFVSSINVGAFSKPFVKVAEFNSATTAAASGVRGEIWAWVADAMIIGALTSVTINLSAAVVAKAGFVQEFAGATAELASTGGGSSAASGSFPAATTSGTLPVIGDLIVGLRGIESNSVANDAVLSQVSTLILLPDKTSTAGGSAVTNIITESMGGLRKESSLHSTCAGPQLTVESGVAVGALKQSGAAPPPTEESRFSFGVPL